MKSGILLRLIVSMVVVVAFVVGATVAEANNSLNLTALLWAQRQSRLLWMVDGFALLALLPVWASAVLQTRLAHKSEEITSLRDHHETQMEDMIQHAEEVERINAHQSKSLESLEGTVAALAARLAAMEADNKTHQENMESETRRLAGEAFAALAGEVQTNTRQMEAVSLAMQYQRAEIKQLRQSIRAAQHPYEISEIARLTPHELAELEGDAPPLMLEGAGKDRETGRRGEEETERNAEGGMMKHEVDSDSSFILHPSSLPAPSTASAGFFEPTMNAGTTFVSPMTEFEITPPLETAADLELPLEKSKEQSERDREQEELSSEKIADNLADASNRGVTASPEAIITPEEYQFLHGPMEDAVTSYNPVTSHNDVAPSPEPEATHSAEAESPQDNAPRGLRHWFMRY